MEIIRFIKENETVGTGNVSDILGSMNVMDPGIKPLKLGLRLVGRALTAKAYPGSIITVHKALYEAGPGDVLVVDASGDSVAGAMFGEIMSYEAQRVGLAGLVVDGAVRDVSGINELGFTVFARGKTPRVGTNRRVGEVNVPINCAGVVVNPGDIIFGDEDGVVVIPQAEEEQFIGRLKALLAREADIIKQIDAGMRVADILNFTEQF